MATHIREKAEITEHELDKIRRQLERMQQEIEATMDLLAEFVEKALEDRTSGRET